eukprot:GFUD01080478.1.p1 GENE.GFUD01080478.1~~GFUD01080478.1.p1  ORF type:complete len:111 (+),score=19.83 GFUD01080478.1:50-382(+)
MNSLAPHDSCVTSEKVSIVSANLIILSALLIRAGIEITTGHDNSLTCHCSCKHLSSISNTHSKIGAVLHMEWEHPDGTTVNLDCDLNVPCATPYDEGIDEEGQYLINEEE